VSGAVWAVIAGLGFGLFQTLNRRAVDGMDLYLATFIQLLVSAVVLALACVFTVDVRLLFSAPIGALLNFAAAGFFHFFIGWTFLNASQKLIGAARTSPLIGTTPLFATLIAVVTLQEFPSLLAMAGIVLIVAGAFIINRASEPSAKTAGVQEKNFLNPRMAWSVSWMGLSAAFCWALSPIFIRAGLKDLPSPLLGVTVGATVSAVAYGVVLLFQRGRWLNIPISRDALAFKLAAGLLVGLSTWARWVALGLAPVAVVLAITMISVPMVIWLSPLVSGRQLERVTATLWAGAALIVGGALLLTFIT
jgi:drug/metabolite transporter (DMT)-like permease